MPTDTLRVMSMGIRQELRDAGSLVQSNLALELIDSLDGLAKVVDFTELRRVTTFLGVSPIPAAIIVNRRSTTIHQVEDIILSFDRFLYDSLPSASDLLQFPPYFYHAHKRSFRI